MAHKPNPGAMAEGGVSKTSATAPNSYSDATSPIGASTSSTTSKYSTKVLSLQDIQDEKTKKRPPIYCETPKIKEFEEFNTSLEELAQFMGYSVVGYYYPTNYPTNGTLPITSSFKQDNLNSYSEAKFTKGSRYNGCPLIYLPHYDETWLLLTRTYLPLHYFPEKYGNIFTAKPYSAEYVWRACNFIQSSGIWAVPFDPQTERIVFDPVEYERMKRSPKPPIGMCTVVHFGSPEIDIVDETQEMIITEEETTIDPRVGFPYISLAPYPTILTKLGKIHTHHNYRASLYTFKNRSHSK